MKHKTVDETRHTTQVRYTIIVFSKAIKEKQVNS